MLRYYIYYFIVWESAYDMLYYYMELPAILHIAGVFRKKVFQKSTGLLFPYKTQGDSQ